MERGVAKLFRGKVTPFGSSGLRFTQSAALSAIAIVGLKSLLEHTRLLTLGRGGECSCLQLAGGRYSSRHHWYPWPLAQQCSAYTAAACFPSLDHQGGRTLGCVLQPCAAHLAGSVLHQHPTHLPARVSLAAHVCAGLQQLQLDVCYMRPRVLQLVGGVDAEPVAQLLDDVVAAAAERSTDPVLMDSAALDKALAAAGSRQQPAAV